jgi:hypothetical protein
VRAISAIKRTESPYRIVILRLNLQASIEAAVGSLLVSLKLGDANTHVEIRVRSVSYEPAPKVAFVQK